MDTTLNSGEENLSFNEEIEATMPNPTFSKISLALGAMILLPGAAFIIYLGFGGCCALLIGLSDCLFH